MQDTIGYFHVQITGYCRIFCSVQYVQSSSVAVDALNFQSKIKQLLVREKKVKLKEEKIRTQELNLIIYLSNHHVHKQTRFGLTH